MGLLQYVIAKVEQRFYTEPEPEQSPRSADSDEHIRGYQYMWEG